MVRLIGALALCLLAASAHATGNVTYTVKATTASPGATIPADFVGYSWEVGGNTGNWGTLGGLIDSPTYFDNVSAASVSLKGIITMANASGKGNLRFGGSSADYTTTPALSQGIVDGLHAFSTTGLGGGTESNWKVIYTLDSCSTACGTGDATTANTQVGYFLNDYAVGNFSVAIGNEPVTGLYTNASYATQFNSYYSTIHTAHSAVTYVSPEELKWSSFSAIVPLLTPSWAGINYGTVHYYCYASDGGGQGVVPALPGAGMLLEQPWLQASGKPFSVCSSGIAMSDLVAPATQNSKLVRVTEHNSVSSGGQAGISDRLIAAAWYLNQQIVFAKAGFLGSNLHQRQYEGAGQGAGGSTAYSPFIFQADGNFAPSPVFYGVYLFSQVEGQQILPTTVTAPGGVLISQDLGTAHAPPVVGFGTLSARGSSNKANIIVVNNNLGVTTIKPDQDIAWTTATVLKVTAINDGSGADYRVPTGQVVGTSCAAHAVALGGKQIGESGTWSGASTTINSGATFDLGPCEAAIVEIQ